MADPNATPSPLSLPNPDYEGPLGGEGAAAYMKAIGAHEKAAEKQEGLAKRFEERRPKEEAESERAYAGAERAMAQPRPPVPQQERVESPPKPEDYHKLSMTYLGAMVMLGAFGGKFIRNAGNAPLAAFNGALQGWQEGNLEAYKEKSAEWKEKQQQVLDNNRARLDEYRTILEDRNASIQDQMLRVKLVAAKHQDKMMYDRADAQNWTGVAQAYDQGVAVHEKAVAATDKIVEQLTAQNDTSVERANQLRDQLPTPQGQQWLNSLQPGQRMQVEGFVRTYADPAPAAAAAPSEPATVGAGAMTAAPAAPRVAMRPELRSPALPKDFKTAATKQLYRETYAAYERGERDSPDPSLDEIAGAERKLHQPRSSSGMALARYIDEHPEAGSDEIAQFAADYAARIRAESALGTRQANIEQQVYEWKNVMPLAAEASAKVPRGKFVPINKLQNNVRLMRSDPRYQEFVDANEAAITAYSSTMSRSGANTVHAQERAAHVLTTAQSDEAYQAGLRFLQREVDAVERSPSQALEEIKKIFGPKGNAPAAGGGDKADDGWGELKVK